MGARRALLYVPGDDLHKIRKATTLSVDCICLDLEDGVAANRKQVARKTISQALETLDFGGADCLVRINPLHSEHAQGDLEAILPSKPMGIVLPKVSHGDQIKSISTQLDDFEAENQLPARSINLAAIVESALGVINLDSIAGADPRLDALIFGAEDYAADIGAQRTESGWEVFYARSAFITYCAAYNLQAIDMVSIDFKDLETLRTQSIQGARMGFTGKQVIHPDQVQVVQAAFTPTNDEIQKAQEITNLFNQHVAEGRGAFAINGVMIDAPAIRAAQAVLDRARAAGKFI